MTKVKELLEEKMDRDGGTGENGKLEYDESQQPFCDKQERQQIVQGYGPLGVALYPDETDSEEPDSGFLKSNNVGDRI